MGGKPRIRRTAQVARELILDAAEADLIEGGVSGLRLVALAEKVGMSHSSILHHFGSRDGLIRAVVQRTAGRMEQEVFAALEGPVDENAAASILERVFRALGEKGHARLMMQLYLARGEHGIDPINYGTRLRHIAVAVHRARQSRERGGVPPFEDTLFTVMLTALSMFGDAIAGPALRASASLDEDPDADRRFIAWLARLLHGHLDK
jgi:AcrR family transcriptional regulator